LKILKNNNEVNKKNIFKIQKQTLQLLATINYKVMESYEDNYLDGDGRRIKINWGKESRR
jgi:hypothetical protein